MPQRIAALVDLLTTLDLRVRAALEGLEDMRRSTGGLDDLREAVLAKLADVDVDDLNSRLDRLEGRIANIERATVHLDETFQSSIQALPDFVAKRIRST